jgi:hypothetical protein
MHPTPFRSFYVHNAVVFSNIHACIMPATNYLSTREITKMFNEPFEFVVYKRFWFHGGLTPAARGRAIFGHLTRRV